VCTDVSTAQLEAAQAGVTSGRYGYARAVERGRLAQADADAALARLSFSDDADAAVADADLVIEAIPEKLELKTELFAHVDGLAPAHAILATNTSGLPVIEMARATGRPHKVIGWHWSSPAPVMKMAEIVVTPETDDDTRATVCALAEACGKVVVVVQDNPDTWGHVGNRIYAAIGREARKILEEGMTDAEGIDTIMTTGWNWPAGPFGMGRGARDGWKSRPNRFW
jgi:3-hydroxyacyl-CoA dehydrogenase